MAGYAQNQQLASLYGAPTSGGVGPMGVNVIPSSQTPVTAGGAAFNADRKYQLQTGNVAPLMAQKLAELQNTNNYINALRVGNIDSAQNYANLLNGGGSQQQQQTAAPVYQVRTPQSFAQALPQAYGVGNANQSQIDSLLGRVGVQ